MQKVNKNRSRYWVRLLRMWHQRMGLVVALIVLFLAFSGLALNHSSNLELDSTPIASPVLLKWYGIGKPLIKSAYKANNQWAILIDKNLFINSESLLGHYSQLKGFVVQGGWSAVAADNQIILLNPDNEVIEALSTTSFLEKDLQQIGLYNDRLVLDSGEQQLISDSNLIEWQISEGEQIKWSVPATPPEPLANELKTTVWLQTLSWERLLLDVHSGRILGNAGVYLMDFAAILLVMLALSGFMRWYLSKST